MPYEIERKFLVLSALYKNEAERKIYVKQAYLSTNPNASVRIRIADNQAFLTIKGKSTHQHTTRFEWEKAISTEEAQTLFNLCETGIIEKHRYIVIFQGKRFEVDEFMGENQGLVMAEIELGNADETFEKPAWLGEEVTANPAYFNLSLAQKPYSKW